MSKKYVQKILNFGACSNDIEPDRQPRPAASALELKKPTPKRKVGNENTKVKRRKWDDDYIKYGFFLPQSEETSLVPSAQCMFCSATYRNSCLAPSKLRNHLQTKHAIHQNKSVQFFKKQHDYLYNQQSALKSLVRNTSANTKPLLFSSFQIAHVLMQQKKPYSEAESVIKPCLKIVANLCHGGKQAVDKVEQIPLSNDTMSVRGSMIADDIKQQLIAKLKEAPCFALQLDETADIKHDAQLIVYCRFPDKSVKKIVEHFLFCLPVGVQTTGEFIFSKLDEFFLNENLSWQNCVAVTTDGAAAMTGKHRGATALIKLRSPECKLLHCILHREALASKKLRAHSSDKASELDKLMSDVVKIVNAIRPKAKTSRLFFKLCDEMSANHKTLLLHSEVRWLSRGKVLQRVLLLRNELYKFLKSRNDESGLLFEDDIWISKLHYMASVFNHLNQLNLSLQGKGGDIFDVSGKIETMKLKIKTWQSNVGKNNLSNFPNLENYMKECNWEDNAPELENRITTIILDHLQLLSENFEMYFPTKLHQDLEKEMWIINPFIADHLSQTNLGDMMETLLELHNDFSQKSFFKTHPYYGDYWVSLLEFPEYKTIALKALQELVLMPTTYLSEKGFSCLVELKTKKRNALKCVDSSMRVALERLIHPRFEKLVAKVQEHPSH